MLSQGFLLLFAGMGTVFIFLTLMVLVMEAAGKYFIVNEARFRPAEPSVTPRKSVGQNEAEVVATVLAAVTAHLRK